MRRTVQLQSSSSSEEDALPGSSTINQAEATGLGHVHDDGAEAPSDQEEDGEDDMRDFIVEDGDAAVLARASSRR